MTSTETPKFNISYSKTKIFDIKPLEKSYAPHPEEELHNYNPYLISNIQHYYPLYSMFFELNENNYNSVSFNHKYLVQDMASIIDIETKIKIDAPVHIKYSPLLDPLKYMMGKYKTTPDVLCVLPTLTNSAAHSKLMDTNNASYIDNFFSFLSSKLLHAHNFKNGIDYYGSYLGVQNIFKFNVEDDLEYLSSSDYFKHNINKLFTISEYEMDEFMNFGSRTNKQRLLIEDNVHHNISAVNIDSINIDNGTVVEEPLVEEDLLVYEKPTQHVSPTASTHSDSSNNSKTNYSTDNDSDKDDDSESDESGSGSGSDDWETESDSECDDDAQYAYIKNFPVQLICLEKCEGTFDELFEKEKINENTAASALFQIIMSLITYQKTLHFTHNDLHTNNIMYIKTDVPHLYYKYNNTVYKVPTYGKIFKLIDFGRSIYRFQGRIFCSDSFANGGDAATQYNCEPYMNENKPRLDPNYSFDLCRLGCSIYDFIIDDDENPKDYDELQRTVARWCTDDNGKNILYKKNGEERYPNFKLYKMIARTVHKHTPQEQLEFSYFNQFKMNIKKAKNVNAENIMDIDAMPSYV